MRNGSYYIRDRSQVLSDLLARTIEQGGGKIIYREKAEGISLKDGAVKSISNSLGERIMMSLNSFNSSKSLSPVTRYRALAPRAHAQYVVIVSITTYSPDSFHRRHSPFCCL